MKFNWGTGIALSIFLFVALLASLAIYFMNQKVDLVATNYYEKELAYQNDIDRMTESQKLSESVSLEYSDKILEVGFPGEVTGKNVKGEIHFYKPSDSNLDFRVDIDLKSDSVLYVKTEKLSKGMWKAKISWHTDRSAYYNEETIIIE